jgi:hypothetical protein
MSASHRAGRGGCCSTSQFGRYNVTLSLSASQPRANRLQRQEGNGRLAFVGCRSVAHHGATRLECAARRGGSRRLSVQLPGRTELPDRSLPPAAGLGCSPLGLGFHVLAGDTPALTGCRPLPLGRNARYCLVCCCPASFSFMKASARFDISAGGTSSTCVAIVQTWPKGSSTVPERSP